MADLPENLAGLVFDRLASTNPQAVRLTGLDDAVVGVAYRNGMTEVPLYSVNAIINILMEDFGLSEEEANTYFDGNHGSIYVGDGTPMFMEIPCGECDECRPEQHSEIS